MFKSMKAMRLAAARGRRVFRGVVHAGVGDLRRRGLPSLRAAGGRREPVQRRGPRTPGADRLPDRL